MASPLSFPLFGARAAPRSIRGILDEMQTVSRRFSAHAVGSTAAQGRFTNSSTRDFMAGFVRAFA